MDAAPAPVTVTLPKRFEMEDTLDMGLADFEFVAPKRLCTGNSRVKSAFILVNTFLVGDGDLKLFMRFLTVCDLVSAKHIILKHIVNNKYFLSYLNPIVLSQAFPLSYLAVH